MSVDKVRRLGAHTPAVLAALAITLISAFVAAPVGSAAPAGFQNTRFALAQGYPTSLAFLPDGRMLQTSLFGDVYLFEANGTVHPSPVLSLPVCADREQGLAGIAVSPDFQTDQHVFLYYTARRNGACGTTLANGAINRLSRFVMDPASGTIDASSEQVLIDNIPAHHGYHNGGGLRFGKDGLLYLSIGDGGCHYLIGDCAPTNFVAQELNSLQGKVVRITPSGGVPDSNPYLGAGTARCAQTGYVGAGLKCQEIFAYGLRNPFRMGFDDSGPTTRFFINDVGGDYWEEVNPGAKGANYGWPHREGPCVIGSYTNCPAPPPGTTDPVHAYEHTGGCSSITGGAFVPPGIWPTQYNGGYLFGDFVCAKLQLKSPAETGPVSLFEINQSNTTDMTFGPTPNGGKALYVIMAPELAEIRKITYVGSGNRAPVAAASADKNTGPPPLAVAFDGSGSSDADNHVLTYAWEFGDGGTGTGAKPTHTYAAAGSYTAKLTVTDTQGASDSTTLKIVVGNAPVPVIETPAAGDTFVVGQQYTLNGSATDAEDGQLAPAKLTWQVRLHHNDHFHPYVQPVAGNGIAFTGPSPEDLAAASNSNLEIRLTATDSDGLSTTVVRDFDPRKVTLSFETRPSGLRLELNDGERSLTAPGSVVSWQGHAFDVEAPDQVSGGRSYVWRSWSDGGARKHKVTTPASATTYRATFARDVVAAEPADFNGDGYGDTAIGAPGEDLDGAADAGIVNVVYGSAGGLTPSSAGVQYGQSSAAGLAEEGDRFGAAIATGDFNADGYSDLVVGAPGEDLDGIADAGIVNVLYGSASGLSGNSAAVQLTQSQIAGLNEADDRFASAVAAADVDGDGYADLLVGAPDEDLGLSANAGVVNVRYGSAGGLSSHARDQQWSQSSAAGLTEADDRFGAALAGADFDGDGRKDLLAGAPGQDLAGMADTGIVNIMYGTASGLAGNTRARQLTQSQVAGLTENGDQFGTALAVGDYNGDRRADLAAGAPGEDIDASTDAGIVNVAYGTASGITSGSAVLQYTQSQAAGLTQSGDRLGAALATGDFDGDRVDDLAAGAPDESPGVAARAGVVNVQYGSATGLTGNARAQQWTQSSAAGLSETGDRYGASLTAGDYDGDGRGDLLGGAPGQDLATSADAGIVNLMYGTASGLAGNTRAIQLTQSQTSGLVEPGDQFGAATGSSSWLAAPSPAS
jgi:glucose/arabinose dehydrogenase/PKD repeat protein